MLRYLVGGMAINVLFLLTFWLSGKEAESEKSGILQQLYCTTAASNAQGSLGF